jgi:hypothetical protein
MISTTMFRRSAALLLAVATMGVMQLAPTAQAAPVSDQLNAGGEYFPVDPVRVFDNKDDRLQGNDEIEVDVVGVSGIPESGVLAVAVNVTIADAPGRGFVSVRPSDFDTGGEAGSSLLNFQYEGHTVPNFGIIGVGADGKLTVQVESNVPGDARIIVDVFGFVATSSFDDANDEGARMKTVTPERILDTRIGPVPAGYAIGNPLNVQETITVPVRGQGPVPDDENVSAVVVNLTGINNREGNAQTYLAASADPVPAGQAEAESSSGNYPKGVVKASLAIVPMNDDGTISIFNRSGAIHVALDVVGYLIEGVDQTSYTGRIVPLEAPFRSFDTRDAEFGNTKLGRSAWEEWSFEDFVNSVRLDDVAVGSQSGLFGNLTAVGLERSDPTQPVKSFLTLNPTNDDFDYTKQPGNSNLNFDEGGAVANSSIVTFGTRGEDDNMVSAYKANGRTHYILDVYAVILD